MRRRATAIFSRSRTPIRGCGPRRCGGSATCAWPRRKACARRTTPAAAAVGREAIDAYQRLLAEYPGEADAGEVLYQLARAWDGIGEPEQGLATLDRLVAGHPGGAHYAEAQFRRGEIFFSAQRYADAERAYAAVLAHGASDFTIQSLYKHGWSLFKQSREDESAVSFLQLLDRVLVASDGVRRADRPLACASASSSTIRPRALSIGFAGADGVATLQSALNRHGPAPYEALLHAALGDLYLEKERYQDAARGISRVREAPADGSGGAAAARARDGGIRARRLRGAGARRQARAGGRLRAEERVLAGAPRATSTRASVAAVRANLLDLARHHHALAQRGSAQDLNEAVRWYQDFLAGFDDSPEAPCDAAAARRPAVRRLTLRRGRGGVRTGRPTGYAANPGAARAGYAALVAYEKAELALPADARAAWQAKAVDSAIRFADTFPAEPQVPAVLTRTARSLFDGGDRVRAESVAQRDPGARPARRHRAAARRMDGAREHLVRRRPLCGCRARVPRARCADPARRSGTRRSPRTARRLGVPAGRGPPGRGRHRRRGWRVPPRRDPGSGLDDPRQGRVRRGDSAC